MSAKTVYLYVTYLLWGAIAYTAINIPYGSMASALTANPHERTDLSTSRTIGAILAQLFIGGLAPMFIYEVVDGNQITKTDSTFMWVAGVAALIGFIAHLVTYSFTTERVDMYVQKTEGPKPSIQDSIKASLTNKSLIGIMLASIMLLMTMMLMSSMTVYLFPNYYHSSAVLSLMNMIMPITTIFLVSSLANVLARRLGKKEAAIIGLLIGASTFGILYFVRPDSVYVYLAAMLVAYAGLNIFNVIVWAMITDVIDDQEVKTHQRDDGTVYAINSFARKVGQALAAGIGGYALSYIGHQSATSVQPQDVLDGFYYVTTLAPAIGFLICAAALWFLYPLNRQAVEENQATLAQRRGE